MVVDFLRNRDSRRTEPEVLAIGPTCTRYSGRPLLCWAVKDRVWNNQVSFCTEQWRSLLRLNQTTEVVGDQHFPKMAGVTG